MKQGFKTNPLIEAFGFLVFSINYHRPGRHGLICGDNATQSRSKQPASHALTLETLIDR